ncbi:NTE family protein [Sedimentibacter acidaminivorans]|uniref:NTE family protein n=1 Tax=Sedimentibacter acidaminivorans TaxID=913099 RepID=A0ABS4GBG7_9FIRM|nr:patatin-like phospholipase family protein [Sedimentibacter acidaminivorans]MBP1925033.1 NTE family protein [Sedimentibacter acidaminivorans]
MSDIGLVLGGGGAKGAYEIGAWHALCQHGINKNIKMYSGASIGAINCALIQLMDSDSAAEVWLEYDLQKRFMDNGIDYNEIVQIINRIKKGKNVDFDGILSRDGLIELLDELNIENLEKSEKDFYASVVNITKIPKERRFLKPAIDWYEGRKTGFTQYINLKNANKDFIVKVLSASSALPVIYTPIIIEDQYFVDGGVNDNLPIYPVYQSGYRKIIVISCERVNYFSIMRRYPSIQMILIQPSRYLGNLLNGTLNFNQDKLKQSFELGYNDAMNAIKRNHSIFGTTFLGD